MKFIASDEGFSFIELAVVLVIIGTLIGLGAGMVGTLSKRAKYNRSEDIVSSAVESVISYGASRNKLPVTGDFTSTVSNPKDSWEKPLYYVVDSNLTSTSLGGICGRKTTNLTVTVCPDLTCGSPTSTINNVAFMVLSGAANYNNQTAGTQSISSSTTIKVFEADYTVDNYTGDMDRPEEYDDIVDWVGIDELRTKVNCTGAALRIINNELPFTYEDSDYSAAIYADGGVPFSSGGDYRWCREESTSSGLTFTPSTLSADCLSLAETSWSKSDSLDISGTSSTAGTYQFTFYVRDNNDASGTDDNITERSLVLTVNPSSSSDDESCSDYRVWNNTGSKKDFDLDDDCDKVDDDDEITESSSLNSGESITRYNSKNNKCTAQLDTFTYSEAGSADSDGDCCVNYDGTDRTCP